MNTNGSINQAPRLSRASSRMLGLALLPAILTACSESPTDIENDYVAPPAVERAVTIQASTLFAQEGETVWVEIQVPGRGLNELAQASAVLTWDANRFEYVGISALGWDQVEGRPVLEGELDVSMSGPAGLLEGILTVEFRALEAGPTDGFGLDHLATAGRDLLDLDDPEFDATFRE